MSIGAGQVTRFGLTGQIWRPAGNFSGKTPNLDVSVAVVAPAAHGSPRRRKKLLKLPDGRLTFADDSEIRKLLNFYKVDQETLEATFEEKPTRRQMRRIKDKAVSAPLIIEELEEEEDLKFIVKEVARMFQ